MEGSRERVRQATSEPVEIVDYDPEWPTQYEREREHLLGLFPKGLIVRIEHIGSTAIPGMPAKPIVDILIGVTDLRPVRECVAPTLEAEGYEYFWRPTFGDDEPPFYAWFIKRNALGERTHHVHVVEMDFREHWDRVLFRDYLRAHPDIAGQYAELKRRLAEEHEVDRVAYARAKRPFIDDVTAEARRWRERAQSNSTPPKES